MHKRKIISVISVLLIPVCIVLCYFYVDREYLYITCALTLTLSFVPFFLSLESGKLHARELVVLSSMTAIAVAGRCAFYALPQVKPTCAVVIITAIVFGSQAGFLTGSLSMLLSNFIFGQGMWTPFQMFAMGMCGLIAGLLFHEKKSSAKPVIVACVGAVICFFVYGFIADLNSVFMLTRSFDIKSIITVYSAGIPFNLIHAVTTFVVILVALPVFKRVLERIKIKYALFE